MRRSTLLSVVVGFRTLRVNPLRTVLSTLGVIIGVAALVAVLALGDGMERFAREEIANTSGVMGIELRSLSTREVDGIMIPDTTAPVFTAAHAGALEQMPGVASVSMLSIGPTMVVRDTVRTAAIVRGTLANLAEREKLVLTEGRFFTAGDVAASVPVVVLSEQLAKTVSPAGTVVGSPIMLNGTAAQVIGVYRPPTRQGPRPPGADRPTVLAPVSVAQRFQITSGQPQRPTIMLVARAIEDVKPVQKSVQQWILAEHPDWRGKVQVRADDWRGDQARKGILLFKLLMGAMTGISLIVGGIGIMNVLLASVAERTREIGIRKATGARQRDILVQFLSESVAISGMGSAIGLAVGFAGAVLVTAVMRRMTAAPVQAGFSLSTFLVTATAAIAVGLIFGTYPALRAARLSPIEAMYHE